jgi:hypothetical protein
MSQYTLEQIVVAVREAEKHILPAKLSDPLKDGANGYAIAGYITQHSLPPTADNFYAAINALVESLEWVVKPAKLVAMEKNAAPAKLESSVKLNEDRAKVVQAAEVADAKAKADEASIKQAKSLIAGYTPIKSTPNGQRIDYREQTEMQELWTKALNNTIAQKADLQSFATALNAAIQKRYQQRELAAERI